MGPRRKQAMSKFWEVIFTEPKLDGTLRASNTSEAMAWISEYFTRARDNDFIMGRTARSAEHPNWRPDIDYLMSERGMTQVIEKTGGAA